MVHYRGCGCRRLGHLAWAHGEIQARASYKRPLHRLRAPPPAPRKQHQGRCILRAGASMEFEVSYSLDNADQFWEGAHS